MDKVQQFLDDNPMLQRALDIAKMSQEQYARALESLSTPAVFTAAGSNEGAEVLHGQLDPGRTRDR